MQRPTAVCVEIGASGVETVVLGPGPAHRVESALLEPPAGTPLLVAVPGFVANGRVLAASNLNWYDVDPAEQLGLRTRATLVCNDAEAAARGESALRDGNPDLVFMGIGTGVGGAVVTGDDVKANLFAHQPGFGNRTCSCAQTGCLETVAGGWALPTSLADEDLAGVAAALARAVEAEPLAAPRLVVLAGGVTRAYPALVTHLQRALPERVVEASLAPGTKSAAAWGLLHLLNTTFQDLSAANG